MTQKRAGDGRPPETLREMRSRRPGVVPNDGTHGGHYSLVPGHTDGESR